MDIEQDINVMTPTQPNKIEMEVDDTTDVVGSNTGRYIQPVGPPLLSQPLCCRKQVPRNLSPQIRGKLHRFSDAYKDDHINSSRGHGVGKRYVLMVTDLSAPDWYKRSREEAAIFFLLQSDSEAN